MSEISTAVLWGVLQGVVIGLSVSIPILLFSRWETRKRNLARKRIRQACSGMYDGGAWYAVRSSSECTYREFWKFLPWDCSGLIHVGKDGADFHGEVSPSYVTHIHFQPEDSRAEWEGVTLRNGNIHWFSLATHGVRYHFTSETGVWVFGSKKTTQAIFDNVRNALAGRA